MRRHIGLLLVGLMTAAGLESAVGDPLAVTAIRVLGPLASGAVTALGAIGPRAIDAVAALTKLTEDANRQLSQTATASLRHVKDKTRD